MRDQSTLVVGNLTAFRLRYGNTPRVAGEFSGNLDNTGEALKLTDSSGETVLEFTYDGTWLPITNKGGYTLCARTPTITPYDGYNEPTAWAASGALAGSPGTLDPYFTITYKSWLNDHFTLVEQMNSALAGAVADPDNDGQSTYKEYLLGTNPRLPDVPQLPSWAPMTINGTDYGTISFNRRLHAIDINLIAEAATTPELVLWESTLTQVGDPVDIGNGMERVIFQDNMPLSQSKRVLRVRDSISGIVWVAPFSQSISFDTLPDIQYTLEPIQLFASSDSGLAVNFKIVSGPALLNSGNAIQVIGIGVVTISANQPGNAGYLAAPEITRAFNVAKGDQTIDFPAIEDQFFFAGTYSIVRAGFVPRACCVLHIFRSGDTRRNGRDIHGHRLHHNYSFAGRIRPVQSGSRCSTDVSSTERRPIHRFCATRSCQIPRPTDYTFGNFVGGIRC